MTLMAEVEAPLLGMTLLGAGASWVMELVNELTCPPVVIAMRRSVQMPAVARVHTALSDTHVVASLRVPPSRVSAV